MKTKRILLFLLAAAAVLYLMPMLTFAAQEREENGSAFLSDFETAEAVNKNYGLSDNIAETADDYLYIVDSANNAVVLSGVKNRAISKAKIPSTIDGRAVTIIGSGAFFGCTGLNEVIIPESVTKISAQAFYNCAMLGTVNIPKSVENIESFAFLSCNSLTGYAVDEENTFYSSIGGVLFDKAGKTLIMYPNGKSGDYTVPSGTKTIEDNAFYGCKKITSVSISASVEEIGGNPFVNGTMLENIFVDAQNTHFVAEDGVLFNKEQTKLISFPNGKGGDYTIPDSVEKIETSAFNGCSRLTAVTIPSNVKEVGAYGFSACTNLTSVVIPNRVTKIGDYTFTYCTMLENIVMPDGVTDIGNYAFAECYALTGIVVPPNVKKIGDGAFSNCSRLKSVVIPNSVISIGNNVFEKIYFDDEEQENVVEIEEIYYIGTVSEWNGLIGRSDNEAVDGKVIYITHARPKSLSYDKRAKTVDIMSSADDIGAITVKYYDEDGEPVEEPTDAGVYTVKIDIAASGNHSAVSNVKVTEFTVTPRMPIENQKTSAVLEKQGQTLSKATVTYGEIIGLDGTLDGEFEWEDSSKAVYEDKEETMIFTPYDKNYSPVTINVMVDVYHQMNSGVRPQYTVRFDTNGAGKVESQKVLKNQRAKKPKEPIKDGYVFDGWCLDKELTLQYDFSEKVTKNITLYAKWTEEGVKIQFADVKEDDWFCEYVNYVSEKGLMYGIGEDTFEPYMLLSRGMLASIIYRIEGDPATENKRMPFSDVVSDSYYFEAVNWALQNGIVKGVTETSFALDKNVTREQIAAILYRYANRKGYDTSAGENTNILSYADFGEISEYATEAMQYAVGIGVIQGRTASTLNPKDFATRAEFAAMIRRLFEYNK